MEKSLDTKVENDHPQKSTAAAQNLPFSIQNSREAASQQIQDWMEASPRMMQLKSLQDLADQHVPAPIQFTGLGTLRVTGPDSVPAVAAEGLIQMEGIKVNYSGSKFTITGRPSFRAFVKRTLVATYNQANGTNHDADDIKLSDEDLDQCHKMSWKDIRTFVENFLNGAKTASDLRALVTVLYNNVSTEESLNAMDYANALITEYSSSKGPAEATIVELLTLLNSATPNLRLDDSSTNRKIRQHFDAHLEATPSGQHYSMSPHSRALADSGFVSSAPKSTKDGASVFSSSVSGSVNKGNLSPKTKKSFEDM